MADLRAAILERVDQLEATARAAIDTEENESGRWDHDSAAVWDGHSRIAGADRVVSTYAVTVEHGAHIAAWHPQAVLTLCAGARQLLDWTSRHPEYEPAGIYAVREEQPIVLDHLARMLGIDPDADDG